MFDIIAGPLLALGTVVSFSVPDGADNPLVWVIQDTADHAHVLCRGEDYNVRALTAEPGEHVFELPPGSWDCVAGSESDDEPIIVFVTEDTDA